MSNHRWISIGILTIGTLLILVALTVSASAFSVDFSSASSPAAAHDLGPAAPSETTTLTLSILSSPWAPLDHNDPAGNGGPAPDTLVVEAVVTNTGSVAAQDLVVHLNYDEDPGNNWVLLDGENPLRTVESLGPGEARHVYWLAAYSTVIGASHQYTVTAGAANASEVATSDNYFGNPSPGQTLLTREYRSTGSSGITSVDATFIVGVAYTLTVGYDLGNDPAEITFSPVGNSDFDAGTTRLLGVSVTFSNDAISDTVTVPDRIYFESIPTLPGNITPNRADIVFRLLPLTPADIELCSYAAIIYNTAQDKYDQFFCEGENAVPISGDVSMELLKSAHIDTIQQNEVLTYTLHYSNTGAFPLESSWIWDDVDPAIGAIISGSIDPPADPGASNANRVAWDLGTIAPAGEIGSSGALTFAILVDGAGVDLADGALIENNAFFGVNPGSLPSTAALTATVTSTVQAPTIVPSKSDGLSTIGNGERLTYTLNLANVGSSTATGLVVSDVLPAETTLAGPASPPADSQSGQTLVWTGGTLGDLAPGATLTITIPVTVGFDVATFTVLSNTVAAEYQNTAGYTFDPKTAGDETTVFRRAGFIDGYAFIDDDGDGQRDPGEGGLSGVAVSLPGAVNPNDSTDGDGYYNFRVEFEGPISVTAGLPSDYFRTTPGTVYTDSHFAVTQTINFGYAPLTSTFGVVFGTVYEDANHNGVQDSGENGLSGVSISSPEAVASPATSNALGQYTLLYSVAGPASITETNPPNYVSTTPDNINLTVAVGSSNGSPFDFGDFRGIKISGQVFEDANFNGLNDDGSGLAGATVSAGADSHLTGASGDYTLYAEVSGGDPIQVTESDPAGYVSTAAVPGTGMSALDDNTLQIDTPISGTVYTAGDFGDVLATGAITISGLVWEDDGAGGGGLANGQQDGSEGGLAGATVSLDTGLSSSTGSDGLFTLVAPAGRVVTVTETNPDGYVSTNAIPGNGAVRLSSDSLAIGPLTGGATSANNKFGDVLPTQVITISGYVWNDNGDGGGTAGDGIRDAGEPGLAGAMVALNTGPSEMTGPDGFFLMHAPPNQEITLSETNPAGYLSTNAIPGNNATKVNDDAILVSALAAGSTSAGNLFGDVLSADLLLSKSDDPDPVAAGATLTYMLSYTNTGRQTCLLIQLQLHFQQCSKFL